MAAIARAFGFFWMLACGLLPDALAAAEDAKTPSPDGGQRFAAVWRIRGYVVASGGTSAVERELREGDPVFVGERLRSASTAEIVLKTDDSGIVALRPGTEFIAESFAAQGTPTDGFSMRLITGSLRVITGWIGRTNRAGHRIATPSATIGIRGTDHEPYVLAKDLVGANIYRAGTYDKVNRGATVLEAAGQALDIEAGKVGFARSATPKDRALLTILLPVLLEKVPDFYLPGQFDVELDRYAQTADEVNPPQLAQKREGSEAACDSAAIAKTWLEQLDGAIVRRDAASIIAMFAREVEVRVTVIKKDGDTSSIDLSREELAQSTIAAMKQLTNYSHRRVSLEAKLDESGSGSSCERIDLRSVAIEQGLQAGKPFRFESLEQFVLELRDGKWLAIKAETTQR